MINRLEIIRDSRGLTREQLAEKLGTTATTIYRLEKGIRELSPRWMDKISKALNIPAWHLIQDPDLIEGKSEIISTPVIGEVQAGVWHEADILGDTIGELENVYPPAKYAENAYALRVSGESMNLVFPHGTYLICVPWQQAPPVTTGTHVIVKRAYDGGFIEMTVKEYRYNGRHELWPRSTDDRWQDPIIVPEMTKSQKLDNIEITFEGVVISAYREEI